MLKEATCFYYNGEPHTIICADPLNRKYWCAYVDMYDIQYRWLDMKIVEDIVEKKLK